MAQIVNDPRSSVLGRSLSTGLSRLAEETAKSLQNRRAISQLTDTGAFDKQTAAVINSLPEKDRWSAIQALAAENNPQQMQGLDNNQDQAIQQQQLMQQAGQEGANAPQIQQQLGRQQQGNRISPESEQQRPSFFDRLIQSRDRAMQAEANKVAQKESLESYKTIRKEGKAADKIKLRLNRMEKLINEGSLPISSLYNGFKDLSESESLKSIPFIGGLINPIARGIGLGGLAVQRNITSRDLEEFDKLSADFVKEAKDFFGSRLTDADLAAFMRTVPTLSQTDAGKKQLINNMRDMADIAKLKEKAADEIIRANRGRRPPNFEALIDEYIGPELDVLADRFVNRSTR